MSWLSLPPVAAPMTSAEYRKPARALRQALLQAQSELREAPAAALLLLAGVDGAGKGETVQLLNDWMDPRWIRTHAFDETSAEETERPAFWRYWRRLPARGEIAIFLSAWYSNVLLERVDGGSKVRLAAQLDRIRRFERKLADDGTLVFKVWLHLGAEAQAARFRELEADPLQSWRVTPRDWENWSRYDAFASATEEIIEGTHSEQCAWRVVDGSDGRRRALECGDALRVALRDHLTSGRQGPRPTGEMRAKGGAGAIVSRIEPASALEKGRYRDELSALQGTLSRLHREAREARISLIGVFEGRDAAGKGGAIRRVVAALDPRRIDVVRIGPPSDQELRHHYLWRFWRRMPRAGRVTLFDRSWYGRVLAERVEELASEHEWRRAYGEINEFEQQVVDHGTVLVKFWLDIDRREQARRFDERDRVPHKRWKLTEDDRRNRRLWKRYDAAIAEMLDGTSTDVAPWTIVPADDKRHARLEVLRAVVAALEKRLGVVREAVARGAARAATGDPSVGPLRAADRRRGGARSSSRSRGRVRRATRS